MDSNDRELGSPVEGPRDYVGAQAVINNVSPWGLKNHFQLCDYLPLYWGSMQEKCVWTIKVMHV